nr:sugar kinase [Granulosicoccus sp.]
HAIERSTSKTPGLYAITTDDHGERSFTYWRDNSAAKDLFQTHQGFSFAVLSQFDVIFFSGISLAILPATARDAWLDWLAEHRQQVGKTIVFDSNYRPRLWGSEDEARHYMSRAWSVATIALPSVDDEQLLHGDATDEDVIDRIRALGVPAGVLKRGAEGPVGFDSNALYEATQTNTSALSVNVVDTTAAGDSFNGAYIASLLMGESPQTALVAAHQCAVKVIGFRGAIVPKESFKASP